MTIEQNKRLAREFFECFSSMDAKGALARMTDDATWWIAGKAGSNPSVGVKNKDQLARLFAAMGSQLKNGLKMTVKGAVAEGDKVALEVESLGELKNGRVYNQEYHMLLTFRDGKVAEVREYLDTQHVQNVWYA